MKKEQPKTLQVDLTCYNHRIGQRRSDPRLFISGTAEAYAQVGTMLEDQLEKFQKFGPAKREIVFRKPSEFKIPVHIEDSSQADYLDLRYFKNFQIKLVAEKDVLEFSHEDGTLKLNCSVAEIKTMIEVCQIRQRNDTHGMSFLVDEKNDDYVYIHSSPLGDWLASE